MVRPSVANPVRGVELESVNWNVTCALFTAVDGVPVICPAEFTVKPAGSVLPVLVDHLRGAVPPLPVKLCEYATPADPLGSDVVVIDNPPTQETVAVVSAIFGS